MPSTEQLAYIAGFLEADGWVGRYKNGSQPDRDEAAIGQKDPKVLYWIQGVIGYGRVSQRRDGMYMWKVTARQARDFLRTILPYMLVKKDKAEEVLGL